MITIMLVKVMRKLLMNYQNDYPLPKPFAPTIGARDVAGDAPTLPEFWYRQRSLYPQWVADECLRNSVAIV